MNMQGLLKQAQKMQKELVKIEGDLKEKVYDYSMGGGVIKVEVTGAMEIKNIEISEELLSADGKEDLQEMLKSSINEALKKATVDKEQTLNAVTGGVKMPGGF